MFQRRVRVGRGGCAQSLASTEGILDGSTNKEKIKSAYQFIVKPEEETGANQLT